jgi:hypothetical protein
MRIQIYSTFLNLLRLAVVPKRNRFVTEKVLVDVRMLELRANSSPLSVLTCSFPSNIDSVVCQAESVIRSFMLEVVTVQLPKSITRIDNS